MNSKVGQGWNEGVSEVSMQGLLIFGSFFSGLIPVGWIILIGPTTPFIGLLSLFLCIGFGLATMAYHDIEELKVRGINLDDPPIRVTRKTRWDDQYHGYTVYFTATVTRDVWREVSPGSCTMAAEKEEVTAIFERNIWYPSWIGKNGELKDSNIWKNELSKLIKTLDRLDNIRNPFFGNKAISVKHIAYNGRQLRK